jgi:hypothetical protein
MLTTFGVELLVEEFLTPAEDDGGVSIILLLDKCIYGVYTIYYAKSSN